MGFDFTPAETDNALYCDVVKHMTDEEMIKEYAHLIEIRRRGGDREFNLQMQFDILHTEADVRKIDIRKGVITKKPTKGNIYPDDVDVIMLKSSVLESCAHNERDQILMIKLKSGDDLYHYFNFTKELFEEFMTADSQGSYWSRKIKGQQKFKKQKK